MKRIEHIMYEQEHEAAEFMNNSTYRVLMKAVREYASPNSRILDVGCGRGELLKKLVNAGYQASGCDMDDECVKRGGEYAPTQQLEVDEISPEKFNNSFELVVMSHVLEHVDNPRVTLANLASVSSRYLLISIPNPHYLPNIIRSVLRTKITHVNSGHLYSWDWGHFRTFVEIGCGYSIKKWYFDSVALPFPLKVRNYLQKIKLLSFFEDYFLRWVFPRFSRSITAIIEVT